MSSSYDVDASLSATLPRVHHEGGEASSSLSEPLADIAEVSISFTTHLTSIPSLPSSPFTVPVHLTRYGLSSILNSLLSLAQPRPFDFLIDGAFLRSSLLSFLRQSGKGVGETGLVLEVVEALATPHSSHSAQPHPDWLSSVHSLSPLFTVTGCYDRHVRLVRKRSSETGKADDGERVEEEQQRVSVGGGSGHSSAVKCVRMSRQGGAWKVLSGGKDHSVRVWDVEGEGDALQCSGVGRQHAGGVECVVWLGGDSGRFVSGGCDHRLVVWGVDAAAEALEAPAKRPKGPPRSTAEGAPLPPSAPPALLSPLSLISAHTDAVTGLCSPFPTVLYSSSFDSSLRHFDLTVGSQSGVWWQGGGKALSSVDVTSDGRSAAVGGWDGAVRLVDLRASATERQSTLRLSHRNVVSSLSFSPLHGHQLASASYDGTVKVWDIRATVPLLTLSLTHRKQGRGAEEDTDQQLLAVHWSRGEVGSEGGCILSGGADRRLHRHAWQS